MKTSAWITLFYGLLVIAGGVMGYIKAASTPSLVMGLIFGLLLLAAAKGMFRKRLYAAYFAMLLTMVLDAFFTYRWLFSYKFIPSGLMSLISLAVLVAISLLLRKTGNTIRR